MIVLDTHALVWWVSEPAKLPVRARRAIQVARDDPAGIVVSSISTWEIAMLVDGGRLTLSMDADSWLRTLESIPGLRFAAVDNSTAIRSVRLREFPHRDPADRIIAATALGLDAALVTGDRILRSYVPLRTIWD